MNDNLKVIAGGLLVFGAYALIAAAVAVVVTLIMGLV